MATTFLSPELALVIEGRDAARSGRGASLRRAAGISQSELGAAISRSAACVSRWEAGDRLPSYSAAAAYARFLRELSHKVSQNDDALGGQTEREVTTSAGQGRHDGP